MKLASYIDHTLLRPDASSSDIAALCREAVEHEFFSVCVNGSRVREAAEVLRGTRVAVAAVTGFPLGAMSSEVKAFETNRAVRDGATEIDTVLNVGWLREGRLEEVLCDLREVVAAAEGRLVKVILETCLLNDVEKQRACELALEAGAGFVKTSTGFSKGGATLEDVRLMKTTVSGRCGVKASGGIRDRATALAMIEAGASRLGTSAGIAIVSGAAEGNSY